MTAKIIIRDEVNVKIEGLDLTTRRELVGQYKYEIPYARYLPAVRLGRWDGKQAFFQLGGSTYINLLPGIIEHLEKRGYDIELEDLRDYTTTFNFDSVDANSFSYAQWPKGHPNEGQPVTLRDYQIEIINKFLENPQCVQEVATGAGKTLITAALSQRCERHGRTIVIVPNKSLVTQTEKDYRNLGLDVGVYFGDRKEYGHQHTICTWQSLNNMLKNTRNHEADVSIGEFIEGVVCIMVDEVHQAKADVLKTLLTGVFSQVPIRWGLTGTIPKEDYERVGIEVSIGHVVHKLAASELQEQGVLAQCHVNIVQLIDHVEYRDYQSELKYLVDNEPRMEYIAQMIKKISEEGNTLVLVDRISAGKHIVDHIPDAVFVSGATKATDRQEHYDEVAIATNKLIVATYGVAAVGINIPRIFNLVLLEPGKSFVRVIQSIGRGIRKAQDKEYVQIWDVTSTCKFAKRHLTKRKQFYREANYPFSIEKSDWQ